MRGKGDLEEMSSINIGANNADDAFYRYKMPKLQSRVEGRGNGVKTNICNMVDIAKGKCLGKLE